MSMLRPRFRSIEDLDTWEKIIMWDHEVMGHMDDHACKGAHCAKCVDHTRVAGSQ